MDLQRIYVKCGFFLLELSTSAVRRGGVDDQWGEGSGAGGAWNGVLEPDDVSGSSSHDTLLQTEEDALITVGPTLC